MKWIEISGKLPLVTVNQLEKLYIKYTKTLNIKPEKMFLSLVDEQEMTKLNKRFFGLNRPTDVLSFEECQEVIICLPVAKKQAKEFKNKISNELALLFVHGCLHVAGYDHNNLKNAKIMSDLQKKILGKIPSRDLEYK